MLLQFRVALLGIVEGIVEVDLVLWSDLLCRRRGVEGLKLVVRDFQGVRASLSYEAIDSTAFKAGLGFATLFSHFPNDGRLSQTFALGSADSSQEFSAIDFGEEDA